MERKAQLILSLLVALAVSPTPTRGECRQFFQGYRQTYYATPVVAYQQAYVYPQVVYKAGVDLEARAYAEQFRKVLREELNSLQLRQQLGATRSVVLSSKCAKCHNAGNASGGVVLDGSQPVDASTILTAARFMSGKLQPPPEMVAVIADVQEKQLQGPIFEELLTLESASGSLQQVSKPQQAPQPQQVPAKPESYGAPPPPPPEPEDGGLR